MGKFEPKNVDASLCTHIVYAFATLKDHLLTEANDDDPENYDRLIELRNKNPDLQVCSMILKICTQKNLYRGKKWEFYWR